jgi:hypothetical protein
VYFDYTLISHHRRQLCSFVEAAADQFETAVDKLAV